MEYVILTWFVSITVLTFLHTAKYVEDEPVSGFFNVDQGYIGFGAEWAAYVRRLHRAIALPVP